MQKRFNPETEISNDKAINLIRYILDYGTVHFSRHASERMGLRILQTKMFSTSSKPVILSKKNLTVTGSTGNMKSKETISTATAEAL